MRVENSITRLLGASALSLGLCLGTAGMAFAMGSSQPDAPTCPRGQVYNSSTKQCQAQQAGVLPDPELADYAHVLAKAGRYDEALEVLNLMKNPNTAEGLNYRGYATRHLGRLDEGIGYYLQSVRLDPKYAMVREYLGEAYVIKGDMAKAKEQLAVIQTICGTKCEEYEDLAEAIEQKKS